MPRPGRSMIPTLLLHTSWTPDVPGVTINLYQEGTAADGTPVADPGRYDGHLELGRLGTGIPHGRLTEHELSGPVHLGSLLLHAEGHAAGLLNPNTALPNSAVQVLRRSA